MPRRVRSDVTTGVNELRASVRREFPRVDADEAAAVLVLIAAARRVDAWLQGALKSVGLADSGAAVVLTLALAGPPYRLSASRLNEILVITSGGITRAVDRLVRDRIVTRVADPDDGRRVLVQLTRRGRTMAGEILGVLLEEFEGRVRLTDTVTAVLGRFVDVPPPH